MLQQFQTSFKFARQFDGKAVTIAFFLKKKKKMIHLSVCHYLKNWWTHPFNFQQLNQKLREITEEEEPPKPQTCTDLQPSQDAVKTCPNTHTHARTRMMSSDNTHSCLSYCSCVAAAANINIVLLLCFLPPGLSLSCLALGQCQSTRWYWKLVPVSVIFSCPSVSLSLSIGYGWHYCACWKCHT